VAKPEKVTAVAEITERFRASSAALVTEYRGLSTAQLTELRRALGEQTTYAVAKNTLVKRAAQDAGTLGLDDLLTGPTAIAFVSGEPVDAAKALRAFAKDNKALVIKGGFMEGRALSGEEVGQLADLDSREVLLAKLAGAMKGNLAKAAGLFAAPATQVARLVAALQDKLAEGTPQDGATQDGAPQDSEPQDSEPQDSTPSDATAER
jgi:large subunit ribosomal protein L10